MTDKKEHLENLIHAHANEETDVARKEFAQYVELAAKDILNKLRTKNKPTDE